MYVCMYVCVYIYIYTCIYNKDLRGGAGAYGQLNVTMASNSDIIDTCNHINNHINNSNIII